ncbi:MAG: hypothetical protein Ta2D_04110 [Rickettsiales bacterium]|nr:MAG: hypothetical protein Ta2D_04110 [Rickettsiales bacterium]
MRFLEYDRQIFAIDTRFENRLKSERPGDLVTLANLYENGHISIGGVYNLIEAKKWLQIALDLHPNCSQRNQIEASLERITRQIPVQQDTKVDGVNYGSYFNKKDSNNPAELLELGNALKNGRGDADQSPEHAMRWYKRAAELGNVFAMYNYANGLERGEGCEVNLSEAIKWYKKGAELKDTFSKTELLRLLNTQQETDQQMQGTQLATRRRPNEKITGLDALLETQPIQTQHRHRNRNQEPTPQQAQPTQREPRVEFPPIHSVSIPVSKRIAKIRNELHAKNRNHYEKQKNDGNRKQYFARSGYRQVLQFNTDFIYEYPIQYNPLHAIRSVYEKHKNGASKEMDTILQTIDVEMKEINQIRLSSNSLSPNSFPQFLTRVYNDGKTEQVKAKAVLPVDSKKFVKDNPDFAGKIDVDAYQNESAVFLESVKLNEDSVQKVKEDLCKGLIELYLRDNVSETGENASKNKATNAKQIFDKCVSVLGINDNPDAIANFRDSIDSNYVTTKPDNSKNNVLFTKFHRMVTDNIHKQIRDKKTFLDTSDIKTSKSLQQVLK